jgi:hypothetical protein
MTMHYDHTSGVFTRDGRVAGTVGANGYAYVRFEGKPHLAHRVAWLLVHGQMPSGHIDHIDGNPLNNAIANLRDVDRFTNMQNRRNPRKGSTTGLIGATPCKGRFRASIMVAGKQRHIGVFDTAQQAHEAYIQFKREKHAGCTI